MKMGVNFRRTSDRAMLHAPIFPSGNQPGRKSYLGYLEKLLILEHQKVMPIFGGGNQMVNRSRKFHFRD